MKLHWIRQLKWSVAPAVKLLNPISPATNHQDAPQIDTIPYVNKISSLHHEIFDHPTQNFDDCGWYEHTRYSTVEMTYLWNKQPLYPKGTPSFLNSPVQNCLK